MLFILKGKDGSKLAFPLLYLRDGHLKHPPFRFVQIVPITNTIVSPNPVPMHYDENNRRHPHYREQQHQQRTEQQQPYQEDQFNDFRSRWGDQAPLFTGRRDNWQTREESHSPRGRHPGYRKEWLPDQQHRQERDHRRRDYDDNRTPVWQQRDTHFNPNNQHANDRWQYDSNMPEPNYRHERQLPPDDYWDERLR